MYFPKRGDNSVIPSSTIMALGQSVGLVMVSMHVKSHESSMNGFKVMAKVKVSGLGTSDGRTDGTSDGMTEQKQYAPPKWFGVHKNNFAVLPIHNEL